MLHRVFAIAVLALGAAGLLAQGAPPIVDVSTIGPEVGSTVPDFSGVDQSGRTHTLQSSLGPKGAMLVFFRSADW